MPVRIQIGNLHFFRFIFSGYVMEKKPFPPMIDIQALKSVRSFIREVIAKVFTHQFGATKGKLTAMHSPQQEAYISYGGYQSRKSQLF
ncbi:hypothetical protein F7734_38705 [Scytonema sp. UIC 10036]|uniref:hypothetical protein n=1 Tax=Scytonema sp. UIC 10036 TaxID=2304196 RepID=UPI0012DA58A2|nr:hypothetical protein [Scytonema sp. UIC 10036]MUG97925.1 hypothetical protein [Scytonema sp. UIC 10036]